VEQFVRGGIISAKDREFVRKVQILIRLLVLFLISLCLAGCFGERVSEQQHLDSPTLAPGASFSDISPLAKRILKRRPIVDRTGTVLCLSKKDFQKGAVRIKPYKGLLDDVIGYIDRYGRGLDGVEYVYDGFLLSKGGQGDWEDPLVLSIDKNLQVQSRENLIWQMRRLHATSGTLILMDVKTGQILAMTSVNKESGADHSNQNSNLAIDRLINPWPIMVTIGFGEVLESRLQAAVWEQNQEVAQGGQGNKDDLRPLQKDGEPVVKVGKWHWHHFADDTAIWTRLQKEELDNLKLQQDLLARLIGIGFGQQTGIDLPGERQGRLPIILSDNVTQLISSTINSTPLQVLSAYTALLNNNGPVRPRIAMNSLRQNETVKPVPSRLFSIKTHELLLSVLGDNSGPSVAAYWPLDSDGGQESFQVIGLGSWPANKPKISYISVLFDARYTPSQRRGTLGKMAALAKEGSMALKAHYRLAQDPKNMNNHLSKTAKKNDIRLWVMPDLRGMSIRSALEVAGRLGMKIRISGTGKVKDQYPKPGRRIAGGKECVIVCEKDHPA